MRALIFATVATCGMATSVAAEEQMRTLAQSGNWIAMSHQESITASPDICLVMTPVPRGALAFRNNHDVTELRVSNDQWSLPDQVSGTVKISVGAIAKEYEIGGNTGTTVMAAVPDDDVLPLFLAMDKSTSMAVTVGKAKPTNISLSGSTKATNAFRTCAHIKGGPAQSGSDANPF